MEEPLLLENDKKPISYLSTIGILKSAIEIPLKSPTFLIFTILASLPLIFATLLQKLPLFHLNIDSLFFDNTPNYGSFPNNYNLVHDTTLVLDLVTTSLKVLLFDSLNFLIAIATVHSTSKIYTDHHRDHGTKSMSLRDLLKSFICTELRSKVALLNGISTFLFIRLLSSTTLDMATYWFGYGPLVHSRTMALHVVHGITVAMVMTMWSAYNAMWDVGFIFTILEEKRAFEEFSESSNLLRGNWMRGTMLMVLDHAWSIFLGFPILFPSWDFRKGFAYEEVVHVVLVCFGRVMKWVVCMIYYYDCKNRKRD